VRDSKTNRILSLLTLFTVFLLLVLPAPPPRAASNETIPPEAGFLARSYHSPTGETMFYRLFIPTNYDEHEKFPLILWFHNALGRGSDNLAQISGTDYAGTHLWTTPEAQEKFPVFVLAPQISDTKAWARPHANTPPVSIRLALEILDSVEKDYAIDFDRIYVAGQSMGGEATWMAMAVAPGRFAASISLCGYGEDWMIPLVAKAPVWIFQGAADDVVPVEEAREWVAALRQAGGSPKYTEYPGVGHQVWDKAFAEPDLLPWLSSQRRAPVN
jgi:predicted peptidase